MDSLTGRRLRIVSRVVDGQEGLKYAIVEGECLLRVTPGERYAIKATVFEDDRKIKTLTIQRYSSRTGPELHFSLVGDEIRQFVEFVAGIKSFSLADQSKRHITDDELREIILNRTSAAKLFQGNEDIFIEIVRNQDLKQDLVALGYRKKQLARFERLLHDQTFFDSEKSRLDMTPEGVWQSFFESNTWIFGYGLTYQFLSTLDDSKLEQIVRGSDISGPGKEIDAFMKTRGRLSSICFVEIKRHDTQLIADTPYRVGAWPPSKELAGGVAQVQTIVQEALERLGRLFKPASDDGNPTGEELLNVEPRSFLVVGNLSEFETTFGINEQKFRAFELFRRNIRRPEILTFDELFERARFIVEHAE